MARERSARKHRWRRWVVAGVVIVVVLAFAIPFTYIHFIEGTPPPTLVLPKEHSHGSSVTVTTQGTWHVGPGSVAGYRVDETLIGQSTTAVGRTSNVSGTVTVANSKVTSATITVDMASVKSDQPQRDAQFDGRIMDVARYPTATLTLTTPLVIGSLATDGTVSHESATGALNMHGVTQPVKFELSTERIATGIAVLAEIPVAFATWNIQNPSVGGFVTTANHGALEVLLHLTTGMGNAAVTGGSQSTSGGGGGPVTVPSTTVPPLSIPS